MHSVFSGSIIREGNHDAYKDYSGVLGYRESKYDIGKTDGILEAQLSSSNDMLYQS